MYKISLITGDGIGPEISDSAVSVINKINENYDLEFEITKLLAGDKALEITGNPLPSETINIIKDLMKTIGIVLYHNINYHYH